MGYLLGLDIGTSQVKALLVTVEGEIVGSTAQEYPLYAPRPGWMEQIRKICGRARSWHCAKSLTNMTWIK